MKTKDQVQRYILKCSFDELDWQALKAFCKQNFPEYKLTKATKPICDSSYQQFLDWYDEQPGAGDIVHYGNMTGQIEMCTPAKTVLASYVSFDKRLIIQSMQVDPSRLRFASDEEAEDYLNLVKSNGYEYSVRLERYDELYKPNQGEYVTIQTNEGLFVGIYKNTDGDYFYFYAVANGKELVMDCEYRNIDVTLSLPSTSEMNIIQEAMIANKLEWSPARLEFKKVTNVRAERGKRYWYISDMFTVISANDLYTKWHTDRFKRGNYFLLYSDAVYFLQQVMKLRENMDGEN